MRQFGRRLLLPNAEAVNDDELTALSLELKSSRMSSHKSVAELVGVIGQEMIRTMSREYARSKKIKVLFCLSWGLSDGRMVLFSSRHLLNRHLTADDECCSQRISLLQKNFPPAAYELKKIFRIVPFPKQKALITGFIPVLADFVKGASKDALKCQEMLLDLMFTHLVEHELKAKQQEETSQDKEKVSVISSYQFVMICSEFYKEDLLDAGVICRWHAQNALKEKLWADYNGKFQQLVEHCSADDSSGSEEGSSDDSD